MAGRSDKKSSFASRSFMAPLITAVVTAAVMGGIFYTLATRNSERVNRLEQTNSELKKQNRVLEQRALGTSSISKAANDDDSEVAEKTSDAIDLDSAVSGHEEDDETAEKAIGYIKKVYLADGKRYLEIDYIQLLAGEDAAKHRIATGDCKGSIPECMPDNDYLLVNQNKKIRKFPISDSAAITAEKPGTSDADGTIGETTLSFDRLKGYFEQPDPEKAVTPYRIVVVDGSVTKITEIFLP